MNRRNFFKTIMAAPLLAPFLLASKSSQIDELFLISDRPEIFLPTILEELGNRNNGYGRSYSVFKTHPQEKIISQALKASGWTQAFPHQKADLTISFRPLQHPMPPSFTLIRASQIWDIRTKELFSLWQEMNEKHPPSSCLTITTLHAKQPDNSPGTSLRIYMNGRVVEEASLKTDRVKSYWAKQGKVMVKIEQGKVFVPSSSCRHKICCSVPPISVPGARIVCAPNHFLLEIQGPRSIDTIIG